MIHLIVSIICAFGAFCSLVGVWHSVKKSKLWMFLLNEGAFFINLFSAITSFINFFNKG